MRVLLASLTFLTSSSLILAQEPPPKQDPPKKEAKKEEPKAPKLGVGDPAPALKVTKWMNGAEVPAFQPGKVYVVEFWATWCGPCIVMMPHLGELQQQFRDKGVTMIGYTAKDPNNTAEKVTEFVEKRGPKLGYTFAYADNRETYDDYMTAAGQGGIPCSYVVDKQGKIAYIGHPMYLDLVLPKVVDGTWTAQDAAGMQKVEAAVNEVFQALGNPQADPAESLTTFDKFVAQYPTLANIPYFVGPRLELLLKAKKTEPAMKMATEVMDKATKQGDANMLGGVARAMAAAAKESPELGKIALKAAEDALQITGDKDIPALLTMADVQFALGDKAKAQDYAAKAVSAADSPAMKQAVERYASRYDDEKKKDDTKKEKKDK